MKVPSIKLTKKQCHMQSHKDGTVRETFVLLQYTNIRLLMGVAERKTDA